MFATLQLSATLILSLERWLSNTNTKVSYFVFFLLLLFVCFLSLLDLFDQFLSVRLLLLCLLCRILQLWYSNELIYTFLLLEGFCLNLFLFFMFLINLFLYLSTIFLPKFLSFFLFVMSSIHIWLIFSFAPLVLKILPLHLLLFGMSPLLYSFLVVFVHPVSLSG